MPGDECHGAQRASKGRCSPCSLAKSKLRVAPLPPPKGGAFYSPCARRPSEGVGTKGVQRNQPCASGAGRTKGWIGARHVRSTQFEPNESKQIPSLFAWRSEAREEFEVRDDAKRDP